MGPHHHLLRSPCNPTLVKAENKRPPVTDSAGMPYGAWLSLQLLVAVSSDVLCQSFEIRSPLHTPTQSPNRPTRPTTTHPDQAIA